MHFQAPATQLLDAIYQAARERMLALGPRYIHNAYLKVLLEPLSSEARVWVNSDFNHFGNSIYYEIFRPFDESKPGDPRLRSLYYQKASAAISALMLSDDPEIATPTAAERLRVVFQKPRDLEGFLNVYVAVTSIAEGVNTAGLAAAIKAAENIFKHYNPYYYVQT